MVWVCYIVADGEIIRKPPILFGDASAQKSHTWVKSHNGPYKCIQELGKNNA